MATSKILNIKECKKRYSSSHLKVAIDYILEPEKTNNGMYVGSVNCLFDEAYKQMKKTKELFGKTDKRQAYHLIISFKEDEVDNKTAFEIVSKFTKEYLADNYEAVYAIHDNTDHIHGHIIYNSVSFNTGNKYHYKKGDWAKDIQPIVNRLCLEYGLSTIDLEEDKPTKKENYREWDEKKDGKFVWNDMIRRDLDACILRAATFESFIDLLKDKGYSIKHGKHLAIKPLGMERYRRCKSLGDDYSEERIKERIFTEDLSVYRPFKEERPPRIIYSKVKRYKRAKLSKLQKHYYAKLYKAGKLKKKPYSMAWKYKDDIKQLEEFQERYLFLHRNKIKTKDDLISYKEFLDNKKKEVSKEKSKVFRNRGKYNSLFKSLEELEKLKGAENSYQRGDESFIDEHHKWKSLINKLKEEGYLLEEVKDLKEYFRNEIGRVRKLELAYSKEVKIANSILNKGEEAGEKSKKGKCQEEKGQEERLHEEKVKIDKIIKQPRL